MVMETKQLKVPRPVHDRLVQLAADRGTSIVDMVTELAGATPTQAELQERGRATFAYLREHLCPELTEDDVEEGRRMWRALEEGRLPFVGPGWEAAAGKGDKAA